MAGGISSENIARVSISAELLVNGPDGTGRQAFNDFATQLVATGPVADGMEDLRNLERDQTKIYPTTVEGLAATEVDQTFNLTSADPDVALYIYRHDAGGVATLIATTPSVPALSDKAQRSDMEQLQSQIGDARFGAIAPAAEISFAITDEDGNASDVELDPEGHFTPRALENIAGGVAPFLPPASLGGVTAADLPEQATVSFAITDEDGNSSDLELDEAGHLTDRVMLRLLSWFQERMPVANLWDRPPDRLLPIGDSLSAGAGGTAGNRWRDVLSNLTGIPHDPMGIGGETARTITARTSALSFLAGFPGNNIPADTAPVDITLTYQDGLSVAPLVQGSLGVNPVEICGIRGTLSRHVLEDTSVVYRFTRAAAGAAVMMPSPCRVKTAAYDAYRDGFPIIGIGQNGGYSDLEDLIRMNWAMINWTSQGRAGRFLVWTRTGVNAATNAEMEARYLKEFGPRFVNIRAMLSSLWAFQVAGLTPTSDDLAAIAVGSIPPSLRSDGVHHNDAGQYVIAVCFYLAGVSLSYWS
ncbi:hypothetical protein [Gemmobacter sp. 24YEA27]|uniref:hypothetical protein n=1 Tax=Gemmobacter sp. 24YEA27 TaxID=3040672 RepID=UPI0024B37FBC|nr:hypothetical protein [Gemmobacter sp. 24YEA27]